MHPSSIELGIHIVERDFGDVAGLVWTIISRIGPANWSEITAESGAPGADVERALLVLTRYQLVWCERQLAPSALLTESKNKDLDRSLSNTKRRRSSTSDYFLASDGRPVPGADFYYTIRIEATVGRLFTPSIRSYLVSHYAGLECPAYSRSYDEKELGASADGHAASAAAKILTSVGVADAAELVERVALELRRADVAEVQAEELAIKRVFARLVAEREAGTEDGEDGDGYVRVERHTLTEREREQLQQRARCIVYDTTLVQGRMADRDAKARHVPKAKADEVDLEPFRWRAALTLHSLVRDGFVTGSGDLTQNIELARRESERLVVAEAERREAAARALRLDKKATGRTEDKDRTPKAVAPSPYLPRPPAPLTADLPGVHELVRRAALVFFDVDGLAILPTSWRVSVTEAKERALELDRRVRRYHDKYRSGVAALQRVRRYKQLAELVHGEVNKMTYLERSAYVSLLDDPEKLEHLGVRDARAAEARRVAANEAAVAAYGERAASVSAAMVPVQLYFERGIAALRNQAVLDLFPGRFTATLKSGLYEPRVVGGLLRGRQRTFTNAQVNDRLAEEQARLDMTTLAAGTVRDARLLARFQIQESGRSSEAVARVARDESTREDVRALLAESCLASRLAVLPAPADEDCNDLFHLMGLGTDLSLLHQVTLNESGAQRVAWLMYTSRAWRLYRTLMVNSVLRRRFGDSAVRILGMLEVHGSLEQKTIVKLSMLAQKEARAALYNLFHQGYVLSQEVPRGSMRERQAQRVCTLWSRAPLEGSAGLAMSVDCNQSMLAMLRRLDHEIDSFAPASARIWRSAFIEGGDDDDDEDEDEEEEEGEGAGEEEDEGADAQQRKLEQADPDLLESEMDNLLRIERMAFTIDVARHSLLWFLTGSSSDYNEDALVHRDDFVDVRAYNLKSLTLDAEARNAQYANMLHGDAGGSFRSPSAKGSSKLVKVDVQAKKKRRVGDSGDDESDLEDIVVPDEEVDDSEMSSEEEEAELTESKDGDDDDSGSEVITARSSRSRSVKVAKKE